MTKQEAIKHLEFLKIAAEIQAKPERVETEALEMAIKALKQEPSEDCISRQAALVPYKELNDNDTISIWLLRKNIEQLPPVTPQQKTGRWIHGHCGVDDYIKCCECHKEVVQNIVTLEGDLPEDAFSLCPFCGAKMV